jgi:hypothetical protein
MQSGAVGGASFCNSATQRALQLGLWHWIRILRTIVLPGLCPAQLAMGLPVLCQPALGACWSSDKTVVSANSKSGNSLS